MERGGKYTSEYFDIAAVETVHLDFPQQNFKELLARNYSDKELLGARLRYKDISFDSVGARYRGQTSYRGSGEKKSFAIDLEFTVNGQDINGYNELKFNNGYTDESALREVLYSNLARKYIPSAKANFVNLIVNGQNYGVYSNVQKLDKDHAKEWFFDNDTTRWRAEGRSRGFGTGNSGLNDFGPDGRSYISYYTLKGATLIDPWQDLANAAHALGTANNANLIEGISPYLDIDETLWYLAVENLFADDDSYVHKGGMDYYLYFDVVSQRLLPIEYDGNSVLGDRYINWTPFYRANDDRFPLLTKLLGNAELRQRYLAHYRVLLEELLNPDVSHKIIDDYETLIDSFVRANSPVREYSYSEFTQGVESLKSLITRRYNSLRSNSELSATGLEINEVSDSVAGNISTRPTDQQSVLVTANLEQNQSVDTVNLYYSKGLTGQFEKLPMSGDASSGVYTATIPPIAKGTIVRYYIEAIAANNAKTASYSPPGAEHDVYVYQVISAESVATPIVINEVMPSNTAAVADEEGLFGDWIELYNNSNQAVDLSGWSVSDEESNLKRWLFPDNTVIEANSTLIIWADKKDLTMPSLHANFKLDADGENVYLVTPEGKFADKVWFQNGITDQSYARVPNGNGEFSWITNSSFDATNN